MDKLCRIRDLQRAVNQFEAAFEKRYGICLNEGMALCSLSNAERMCPGRLGELLGLTPSNTSKVLRSAESKGLVLQGPPADALFADDERPRTARLGQLPGDRNTRNTAQMAVRIENPDT